MHRLNALGACALAVGLMTFGSSAAQAEIGANWMVNGKNIPWNLLPSVQVKEVENKTGSLLFTTKGGTKVEILCTTAKITSISLEIEGSLFSNGVKFSGCLTKINGSTSAPCKPHSGSETGVITTKTLRGLLALRAFENVTEMQPFVGTTIANIELGEECALGEAVPVTGAVTLKDSALTTEAVDHLVSQGPWTSLNALGQPASLDGSAVIQLNLFHSGLKWSGLPA
jgi:hypothetical protein